MYLCNITEIAGVITPTREVHTRMPDVFTQKLKSPTFKGIQALKFDVYGTINLLHLSIPLFLFLIE